MKTIRCFAAVAVALAAAGMSPLPAQAGADCFARSASLDEFERCDEAAPAEAPVATVTPWRAYELKEVHGRRVLLLDVRSVAEVAFVGAPDLVDAVVPLAELAQPLQADPARGDLRLLPAPHFETIVQAWVAALGGDADTPLLLLCRSGDRAQRAARQLRAAGFADVSVIEGGFEGTLGRDGQRHGGWKDAGLPWSARVDPVRLFGEAD
ncbi:MAG: rhodanese-like domain-containing protein [Burkholderiaceae bacterium]|jgi:rhodanese-related sulfurtransferase|nr:rhodanese-like domain-containing protein [Burkholderiaceae bacterium]